MLNDQLMFGQVPPPGMPTNYFKLESSLNIGFTDTVSPKHKLEVSWNCIKMFGCPCVNGDKVTKI